VEYNFEKWNRTTKVAQKLKVLPEQPEPASQSTLLSPKETAHTGSGEQEDDQSDEEGDDEGGPDDDEIEVSYSNSLFPS
jgi:hypothetical protein